MHQLFAGNESRQRRINLGGTSASASHDELLQQARADRSERQQARQRQEAAIKLQSAWRGQLSRRMVKKDLQEIFDEEPAGISAMRCLVLMGIDEDRLGRWSEVVTSMGEESMLKLARGTDRASWIILIRQLSVMLLRSIAKDPQSKYALAHIKVVNILLSPTNIDRVLPSAGTSISQDATRYMLHHEYYPLLKRAVEQIPPTSAKTSATLPHLVPLFTAPLHVFRSETEVYLFCFKEIIQHILTVPLLPNRLPLTSLSQFSAQLPLHSFELLAPISELIISSLGTGQKVNLLANLAAFMPPRYSRLSSASLVAYLKFLSSLLLGLPVVAFEAPSDDSIRQASWNQDTSSEEEDAIMDQPSSSRSISFAIDAKTRARLQTLASQNNVINLITASKSSALARLSLYDFIMSLYEVWPSSKAQLLTAVLTSSGGGLVRELYRGSVRSSPLGKSDSQAALTDSGPENTRSWLPLLFLTDLYTQALLTMGDDEFFASRLGATTVPQAQRNPLTVDEVVSFSRQLMTIAFVLIWHMSSDDIDAFKGKVPGTSMGWDTVRDKVTGLVQAIHARDSRRPFTPPGHWLASELDMASFADIAVAEEQKLSEEDLSTTSHLPSRRLLSKHKLAQISPRLNVLHQIPFAILFETRVHIFRQFVVNDMRKDGGGMSRLDRVFYGRPRSSAVVRRGHVASDGFDKLANANLKGLIEITFIDKYGQVEAGIDGGGLFKEFFTELCKEVFDTDRGLWLATKNNELYPNPHSYAKEPHSLDWYRFIGRILGKALYEGILVDVAFAGFFLAKWLGKQSYLDDLASLDPELYNGLLFLKNYNGDPEELSLTFAVMEDDLGISKTVNLIPNGSNIPVTKDNRLQYIFLMCHYRLTKQIRRQSEAFFQGLSEMIDPKWIRMFNQQELQVLIGGTNTPVDLDDLKTHTNYGGLYNDDDETIKAFWRVVNTFNQDQRRALLRFVTSCSRPPLLGFRELQPNFSIRDAGTDQNRLPTASTCVNLLKLPRYTNERVLREKLLQAITSGAGFDLS